MKIAEAEGNPFEGLKTIVAAFDKTIGVEALKSVEDIRLPISEHSTAMLKLWNQQSIAGIQPLGEKLRRGEAALCIHKFKEQFLQSVSLIKFFGEIEHHIRGSLILIR